MKTPISAIDPHRMAGLQDAVYGIAMTLLVLELKLPALPEHLTDALLWAALLSIWPKLLTWLLSFWVLAIFWIGDARAMATSNVIDSFLLRLGLCRLALVSLLPFSTALIGEHGDHVAGAAIYAAHLFLLSVAQVIRYTYFMSPTATPLLGPEAAKASGIQAWGTLVCSAAAFGLAFVAPGYNMFALLPLLFLRFFQKLAARRSKGAAS